MSVRVDLGAVRLDVLASERYGARGFGLPAHAVAHARLTVLYPNQGGELGDPWPPGLWKHRSSMRLHVKPPQGWSAKEPAVADAATPLARGTP